MIAITEPCNGAVVCRRHGTPRDGGLEIAVKGRAPMGYPVSVNGAPARRAGDSFSAEVVLRGEETDIVASCRGPGGAANHCVRVVWDARSFPRYRFSVDDCVFFLRDLAARRPRSIFDGPFLPVLRDLHARWGARFVLNLFFQTPEADFSLGELSSDYRGEWRDNADWLKLSFHARAELPDRPYQYAQPERLAADFDAVAAEILRFAGEHSWAPPTVIHWAMLPEHCLPVLVQRGVRALSGFFVRFSGGAYVTDDEERQSASGPWDLNYHLGEERSEYLSRHDALKDFESGIIFSRVDLVCNNTPAGKVVRALEPLAADPSTAEIMDLFTHEQYFWPFYVGHRPDHAARCEAAVRFCSERGYKPVFFHEGLLGA